MVAVGASIRGRINRGLLNVFTKRDSVSIRFDCLVQNETKLSTLITAPFVESLHYMTDSSHHRNCRAVTPACKYYTSLCFSSVQKFDTLNHQARYMSNASVELSMDRDVVRFSVNKPSDKNSSPTHGKKKTAKRIKMSRKAKRNELRFFRLKAKKKMNSPNPEVRIRYKLEKAKRKEAWLIEKLRKFEIAKVPEETQDPEMLTEEERHFLKRTGEKKKNYVPVGRRGVFGGVVLNMHLHWKKHETVKVVCKPCKPGQIHGYAEELTRLSKGIVIDIKANNTIIFYRGKNYVQPEIMSPPNTLSKDKALERYRYEQSLEHTSEFIEKLEKELEEYHKHVALYRKGKEDAMKYSPVGT